MNYMNRAQAILTSNPMPLDAMPYNLRRAARRLIAKNPGLAPVVSAPLRPMPGKPIANMGTSAAAVAVTATGEPVFGWYGVKWGAGIEGPAYESKTSGDAFDKAIAYSVRKGLPGGSFHVIGPISSRSLLRARLA